MTDIDFKALLDKGALRLASRLDRVITDAVRFADSKPAAAKKALQELRTAHRNILHKDEETR